MTQLIEIGCGDGRVLAHCAEALSTIEQAVGVDINPEIIDRNKARFSGAPKVTFACGDVSTWMGERRRAGVLLMSYGGVMEYFGPDALIDIF